MRLAVPMLFAAPPTPSIGASPAPAVVATEPLIVHVEHTFTERGIAPQTELR